MRSALSGARPAASRTRAIALAPAVATAGMLRRSGFGLLTNPRRPPARRLRAVAADRVPAESRIVFRGTR